jgi:hypothetical protein
LEHFRVPATVAPTQNVSTVQNAKPKYKHTRIADIKVDERVVTSTNDTPQPTQVDSVTWKKSYALRRRDLVRRC